MHHWQKINRKTWNRFWFTFQVYETVLPSMSCSPTSSSHEDTVQKKTSEVLLSLNKQHNGFLRRNPAFVSALALTLFPVVRGARAEIELDLQQHLLCWPRNMLSLKSESWEHCSIADAAVWTLFVEILATVVDFSPVGQTVTTIAKRNSSKSWRKQSRFPRATVHF